jgi:hypothetical protein
VNKKLMVGTQDFLFSPAMEMTRAMLVTILYSMEGKPATGNVSPFSDVKNTAWYASPIIWAADKNIVGGIGDGKFAPNTLITRQQVAAIMFKYAIYKGKASDRVDQSSLSRYSDQKQISDYARPAMAWAVNVGLMSGVTSTTLQPQGTCPRAQCATMMVNFDRVINAPEPTAPPTQSPSPSPEAEPDESAEPANTDAPAPSEAPAE